VHQLAQNVNSNHILQLGSLTRTIREVSLTSAWNLL